jgi:hypothetical protein
MTAAESALRRIVADLDSLQQRFALVGGFAVSARTEPRFTRDVDIVVAVSDDERAAQLPADLALVRQTAALIATRGYARGRDLVAALESLLARG